MSVPQAKRLVVIAFVVGGGLAAVGDFRQSRQLPRLRILIAAFVAAAILSAAADVAPDLAGSFAVLVLLSAFLIAGPDVIGAVTGAVTDN